MDSKIAEKIDTFFTQYKHQKYKKGEILIRADDDPHGVFYLKDGVVKEYAISKKGDELVVNVFKPIAFFPMSWAINETPNKYFFEAMTDLDLWRAPKEEAIEFIESNPDVLYDLLSRVYRGTDGMEMKMVYLMSGNAYARLVMELLTHAKRFGKSWGNEVEMKVTEKDLAAQSGMTRETVSREMKILKDKGLVTLNKNILIIKDLRRIGEELSERV